MPVKPRIAGYGSSFGVFGGDLITNYTPSGDIDTSKLNKGTLVDGVEFNKFEESIKDFILARLGFPVVRVELSPFQIKTCIDEAITKLSNHAPMWATQFAVFEASAGISIYELPSFIIDNISYVAYHKALMATNFQSGTLEFDFFISYFTNMFSNLNSFSVGEYLLVQQYMEQIRKVLGREGAWNIIDGKYLQIYPIPASTPDYVIVEYRALNSNTIQPAYRNWIQKYALAIAKGVLGEIRGKYKTLPAPNGGAQLNGEDLINASIKEIEALEEKLMSEIQEPIPFTLY